MIIFPPTRNRGFTLVETLVAITVLLLVVMGPITVAQQGIKSAFYANEQVTAVFLAQEAIEAIRELRDTSGLVSYDSQQDTWTWIAALSGCFDTGGCAYDPYDGTTGGDFEAISLVNNNNGRLNVNTETGEYSYDTGPGFDDSGYTRKVYLTDPGAAGDEVSVRVEVSWTSRTFGSGTNPPVILETWLYDHHERYENF